MQRLELTWIGKGEESAVEPRILLHDPSKDYGDPNSENMLIHGDNLLALKALEQESAGKVKCIYIDPPYNTGAAFEHYDDNLEHSTWLSLMFSRLMILKNLLSEDGSIWISIDDDEGHYLKVLCDETFGRNNFISTVVWQKIHSIKNDAKYLSQNHDFVLVYAKNKEMISFNLLPRTEEMNSRYKNPDDDPRGPWQSGDLVANEERVNGYYDVVSPKTGKVFNVPQGKHWVYSQENMKQMIEDNRIWFGKDGTAFPRKKRFLSEVMDGRKGDTWWISSEVGHNQEAKREIIKIFGNQHIFATPKPERLIERIIHLATNEGDLVLDSFLGSGTTAAVAHKMGRRWIGIELGNHCYTHCKPRLDMVIDGEQGGISKTVDWQGGGGYKFYELAPSFIEKDKYGNPVISEKYNSTMLIAAVAKLNGYFFAPDPEVFWKQGKSHDDSYIYVTTSYLDAKTLDGIAAEVPVFERLLICAPAFDVGLNKAYDNIQIKKIPQSVLDKCEFGVDNYNLNIVDIPVCDEGEEDWEEC